MVCSGFLHNAFYIKNSFPLVWQEITVFLNPSGSYYRKNCYGLETHIQVG